MRTNEALTLQTHLDGGQKKDDGGRGTEGVFLKSVSHALCSMYNKGGVVTQVASQPCLTYDFFHQ